MNEQQTTRTEHAGEAPQVLSYARPERDPLAIRSLTCALAGYAMLILAPGSSMLLKNWAIADALFIAWFGLSVAAIVLGHLSLRRTARPGVRGRQQAFGGLILGWLSIALVGASLVIPPINVDKSRANRVMCAANLRQIGQSTMLYANDNGGRFPPQFDQLITDADLNPAVLVCPETSDYRASGPTTQAMLADLRNPGRCSYVYLGAGLTTQTASPGMIIAHEKPGNHDKDGMNIVFGDGHVEWVEQAEAERILEELKAGHNPPRPRGGR